MPRKKHMSTELSIEEIEAKLAQMDADRKNLEMALKEQRAVEIAAFVESLREQIAERGYHVDEVVPLLRKHGKSTAGRRSSQQYVRYVNPDNPTQSYMRGPIPQWLRDKMESAGYDPSDKAQREEFKATHLKRVA